MQLEASKLAVLVVLAVLAVPVVLAMIIVSLMDFLLILALIAYLAGAFYSVVLFVTRSESTDRYLIGILAGGFAAQTI